MFEDTTSLKREIHRTLNAASNVRNEAFLLSESFNSGKLTMKESRERISILKQRMENLSFESLLGRWNLASPEQHMPVLDEIRRTIQMAHNLTVEVEKQLKIKEREASGTQDTSPWEISSAISDCLTDLVAITSQIHEMKLEFISADDERKTAIGKETNHILASLDGIDVEKIRSQVILLEMREHTDSVRKLDMAKSNAMNSLLELMKQAEEWKPPAEDEAADVIRMLNETRGVYETALDLMNKLHSGTQTPETLQTEAVAVGERLMELQPTPDLQGDHVVDLRDTWNNTKGLVDDLLDQLSAAVDKEEETSTIIIELDDCEAELKEIVNQVERLQSLSSHGIAGASLSKVAAQADEMKIRLEVIQFERLENRIRDVHVGILRTKLQKLNGIRNHAQEALASVQGAVKKAMQTKISAAREELGDITESKEVLYQAQIVDILVLIAAVKSRVESCVSPPYSLKLLPELKDLRRRLHASHPSKIVESARFEGLLDVSIAASEILTNYDIAVIELEDLGDRVRKAHSHPPPVPMAGISEDAQEAKVEEVVVVEEEEDKADLTSEKEIVETMLTALDTVSQVRAFIGSIRSRKDKQRQMDLIPKLEQSLSLVQPNWMEQVIQAAQLNHLTTMLDEFNAILGDTRAQLSDVRQVVGEQHLLETMERLDTGSTTPLKILSADTVLDEIQVHGLLVSWRDSTLKDYGEYDEGKKAFVKLDTATRKLAEVTCVHCGEPLDPDATVCPSCEMEVPVCGVCKENIHSGGVSDQMVICVASEECGAYYHLNHIREHLETQNTCPVCNGELDPNAYNILTPYDESMDLFLREIQDKIYQAPISVSEAEIMRLPESAIGPVVMFTIRRLVENVALEEKQNIIEEIVQEAGVKQVELMIYSEQYAMEKVMELTEGRDDLILALVGEFRSAIDFEAKLRDLEARTADRIKDTLVIKEKSLIIDCEKCGYVFDAEEARMFVDWQVMPCPNCGSTVVMIETPSEAPRSMR